MQSSSAPRQVEPPFIDLTLDVIESFYETVSQVACNSSDTNNLLAKIILAKYLHYLNCTSQQVPLTSNEKGSLQIHLTRLSKLLTGSSPLSLSIFTAIQADFTADGRHVAALFSEPGEFSSFVNLLNDIHAKNLQSQPSSLSPVLTSRAPEIAHQVYVFVSHEQTLELILREGNDAFYMDKFEEALNIFLTGKLIIEAQLEHHTPNINDYAVTILSKIATCYLKMGKKIFTSNYDLAAEYWQLAVDESESLDHDHDNTWLDAQVNLAIYENNKGFHVLKNNNELGLLYFNKALERIEKTINKLPKQKKNLTLIIEHALRNKIEALRQQYFTHNTYLEKFIIAKEIVAVAKNLSRKPDYESSFKIALLMQQNITFILLELTQIAENDNIAPADRLQLIYQVIDENSKASFNVNSNQQILYQINFTLIVLMRTRNLVPALTALQIYDLSTSIYKLVNRLPVSHRGSQLNIEFKELIKAISIKLNIYALTIATSLPTNWVAMTEAQNYYVFILNLLNCEPNLFSAEEKTSWYQIYLIYALRSSFLNEFQPLDDKIAHIREIFREFEPCVNAPEPVTSGFITLQRGLASLTYDYAHVTKNFKDKVYFLNLSNAIIYKIPVLSWNDIDTLNINTSEKLIQLTKAENICRKKITKTNADSLHDQVISLINEMDVIKIEILKSLNTGWIRLLETKRDLIIQYYYKHLDKYIDKLGSRLLSRIYFFDFKAHKRPDINELHQLYHDTLKPLKHNKSSDNISEADYFISEYFRCHGKHSEPLVKKIQIILDTLTAFEADEPAKEVNLQRRYSI